MLSEFCLHISKIVSSAVRCFELRLSKKQMRVHFGLCWTVGFIFDIAKASVAHISIVCFLAFALGRNKSLRSMQCVDRLQA